MHGRPPRSSPVRPRQRHCPVPVWHAVAGNPAVTDVPHCAVPRCPWPLPAWLRPVPRFRSRWLCRIAQGRAVRGRRLRSDGRVTRRRRLPGRQRLHCDFRFARRTHQARQCKDHGQPEQQQHRQCGPYPAMISGSSCSGWLPWRLQDSRIRHAWLSPRLHLTGHFRNRADRSRWHRCA